MMYCRQDLTDPSLETALKGHRQAINAIRFSNDGKQCATASDDNSVMLWSLADKRSICYKLLGHSNAVLSLAFSSQYLLSSSKDCSVRLWRLNGPNGMSGDNEAIVYRCHSSSIRCVDVNDHNNQFCTASDDKTVKLWSSTATNRFCGSLSGAHSNWVRHASYSALNAHLIASCADDGLVCIWDVRSKEAVIRLASRKSCHYLCVAWHPNCEHILSSSSGDASVKIWDLRQEKVIQYYAAHESAVNSVDFHSTGNYLISSSNDETCKIFDLLEGRVLFTLNLNQGTVNCATFSKDGQYFATGGQNKQLFIWKSNLIRDLNANDSIVEIDEIDEMDCQTSSKSNKSNAFKPQFTPKSNLKSSLRKTTFDDKPSSAFNHINGDYEKLNANEIQNINTHAIDNSGDHLSHNTMFDVSHGIVNQLKTLTDSVLLIEQRLSNLELKFESHITANAE